MKTYRYSQETRCIRRTEEEAVLIEKAQVLTEQYGLDFDCGQAINSTWREMYARTFDFCKGWTTHVMIEGHDWTDVCERFIEDLEDWNIKNEIEKKLQEEIERADKSCRICSGKLSMTELLTCTNIPEYMLTTICATHLKEALAFLNTIEQDGIVQIRGGT